MFTFICTPFLKKYNVLLFVLFKRDMMVNLYKSYFQSNKKIFHLFTFPHFQSKTKNFSIILGILSSHFTIKTKPNLILNFYPSPPFFSYNPSRLRKPLSFSRSQWLISSSLTLPSTKPKVASTATKPPRTTTWGGSHFQVFLSNTVSPSLLTRVC